MKKEEKINYKIDSDVLKNYVEAINSIKEPMSQIKDQLNQITMPMKEHWHCYLIKLILNLTHRFFY